MTNHLVKFLKRKVGFRAEKENPIFVRESLDILENTIEKQENIIGKNKLIIFIFIFINEYKYLLELKNRMDKQIQNPLTQEPIDVNKLIKKLEKEGMEKTALLNSKEIDDPNIMITELTKIMTNGDNEFKEKTGRHMTYAEMRATYG